MTKTRYLFAALILAVGAGAAAHTLAAAHALAARDSKPDANGANYTRSACPRLSVPPLYGDVDEVIAAARKLMIRGSVSLQGEKIRLTPRNSRVLSVIVLAPTGTPLPGAAALRATAQRRCGSRTAAASWAVVMSVPTLTANTGTRLAFLVKTKSGWKTY